MKKILYLLIVAAMLTACTPYGSQIPDSLIGNYLNFSNGKWECGLYEEFAIYQNDFWDYESISDSEIVLSKKSGEKAVLIIDNTSTDYREIDGNRYNALAINGTQVIKSDLNLEFSHQEILSSYQQFDGIEKDTSSFKKHKYAMDTALVRVYIRNLAQGARAFFKRSVGRFNQIEVFNYLEARRVSGFPLDSTDHFGYRYEIKIPVTGVSELTMYELFTDGVIDYNSGGKTFMNYIVEPGDTLMFYCLESGKRFVRSLVDIACETYCMGGNYRFNSEKNATIGLQVLSDSTKILNAINSCKVPISDKFLNIQHLKLKYNLLRQKMDSNSLQSIFPISEDEVFSSISVYEFLLDYIRKYAENIESTPENLSQHPDWIIAEVDNNHNRNILINPEFIKNLGFSDDFVEFFRLSHAVQFFDDFSPRSNDLQDYELESIMQHIQQSDYKAYLEEKMKVVKRRQ